MEAHLEGRVADAAAEPLAGVRVKAFADGLLRADAVSDSSGRYALTFPVEVDADPSVIVWWLPEATGLVPELLVLRESAAARRLSLWSACLPRLELGPRLVYDVTLLGEREKLDALAASDCLRESEGALRRRP